MNHTTHEVRGGSAVSRQSISNWYIVKTQDGHCLIVAADNDADNAAAIESVAPNLDRVLDVREKWGPFPSQDEAIARRVGLIRAGKCQPR
ncbi:DDE transposase family protein [Hydrococcus rivularis NIES-593]|uniref:DDE transposase family protein n=1 Tax=Hydrococcus rivularis NIES-593 TaxID=1921803 RepID=A0A1U7HMZ7_9CYAN|nr:DDE transposase family protein [Hydrococcus rivularis]OKH24931.1 DDE transposase family protein [Hydrococcus rivularis NIES-593]